MIKVASRKKGRLSIDVLPEERRKIKTYAALHGETIREYVLASVRERLHQEAEEVDLLAMTLHPSKALKELWDNDKDAAYQKTSEKFKKISKKR